jgi:hypothetical protein
MKAERSRSTRCQHRRVSRRGSGIRPGQRAERSVVIDPIKGGGLCNRLQSCGERTGFRFQRSADQQTFATSAKSQNPPPKTQAARPATAWVGPPLSEQRPETRFNCSPRPERPQRTVDALIER